MWQEVLGAIGTYSVEKQLANLIASDSSEKVFRNPDSPVLFKKNSDSSGTGWGSKSQFLINAPNDSDKDLPLGPDFGDSLPGEAMVSVLKSLTTPSSGKEWY